MNIALQSDLIVFGAGPAGLSAAIAARDCGLDVRLIEIGSRVADRRRHHADHIVTGVGGAGLYSDGKFSYWPSATRLWLLADKWRLHHAYEWFRNVTRSVVDSPPFPMEPEEATSVARGPLTTKSYPSQRSSFESRFLLIQRMEEEVNQYLLSNATVEGIFIDGRGVTARVVSPSGPAEINARGVVLAGGRFGMLRPVGLRNAIPSVFRRYEFGVRIVSTARDFPFRDNPLVDPKLLLDEGDKHWRTFCTIREGEVSGTDFLGLISYSGRADVAPTQFSNFGFNLRIESNPDPHSPLGEAVRRVMDGRVLPFQFGLPEYLAGTVEGFGGVIDTDIRTGLHGLMEQLGESPNDLVVVGPCIEGIGHYPEVGLDLRVGELPVWAAGDTTGLFRGLTAAFVSGYYAGNAAGEAFWDRGGSR